MNTVPTLCATCTAVGVSAVGYALGRPEHSAEHSTTTTPNKRKISLHTRRDRSYSQMSSTVTTTTPQSTPIQFTPTSLERSNTHGRRWSRSIKKVTGRDLLSRRGSFLDSLFEPPSESDADTFDPPLPLRPRSSWVKRLSTFSSHSNSPLPSPRPASPTVSYSQASVAFSNQGSTAPIFPSDQPNPLPPNKLVKRSSSVRAFHSSPVTTPDNTRYPTFRRPATSHQRAKTLQNKPSIMSFTAEEQVETETPEHHVSKHDLSLQWRQYFTARVTATIPGSKRRSSSRESDTIRRILPLQQHHPTLLMATAVVPSAAEVDTNLDIAEEPWVFDSRPATPAGMLQFNSSPPPPPPKPESPVLEKEPKPRRSFSDAFNVNPTQLWRLPKGSKASTIKGKPRLGRRSVSAPLVTMSAQAVTAHGEIERPSKRRDITDPSIFKREIYTHRNDPLVPADANDENRLPSDPSPNESSRDPPAFISTPMHNSSSPSSQTTSLLRPPTSRSSFHVPPSPTFVASAPRSSRQSVAPSDRASTLVGSDNEARGVGLSEEEFTDSQSDTLYDSLRTGATRSTTGARGPRIETIFDESPPRSLGTQKPSLRDLLSKGAFPDDAVVTANSEAMHCSDDDFSTPVRNGVRQDASTTTPLAAPRQNVSSPESDVPSSPPEFNPTPSLGKLEWDAVNDDSDSPWDFEEDEDWVREGADQVHRLATPLQLRRVSPVLRVSASSPGMPIARRHGSDHPDRDVRVSLFDWSEQPPIDKSPGHSSPARPRTVHGKKDAETRGSRSVGRRAPSGLHARSQSVPVVPEIGSKRESVVTNKFGTWGVGSKGVTEDWNDDFDFDDAKDPEKVEEEKRVDSGMSMIVPQSIREQQSNVLANIGLLREWGLLIEELKVLRGRAQSLGIIDGPHAGTWLEVDAMIDLADQEAEEEEPVTHRSPPSSPGFSMDAFDDSSASIPITSERTVRKSIISPDDDIFGIVPPAPFIVPEQAVHSSPSTTNEYHRTRPRKDSEAVARSVIEALKNKRTMTEPIMMQPVPRKKKVPFDTKTLRHIVPYVNGLMRKAKEALRETEGLYSSPNRSPRPDLEPRDPPLTLIFNRDATIDSSPSSRKTRRSRPTNTLKSDDSYSIDNELSNHMKLMTVM